jgi:acetyltransferase-like isoleucine patch superfamily enzyme
MIKQFVKNLVLREKASSQRFVAYLRKQGVQVGERVRFYSPPHTLVDLSAPWLITIGDNVCITHGVIILTHDYSWAVLKQLPDSQGAVFGAQSPVKIGSNVFIGMNAVITRGVTIGDNVIIGAGSVVTSDCESNGVYAGSPARRIMSVDQYREKRAGKQFAEAKTLVREYRLRFGKDPAKEVLAEYFMLFSTPEQAQANPVFCTKMKSGGNYDQAVAYMQENPPMFESYEAFLEACREAGGSQ